MSHNEEFAVEVLKKLRQAGYEALWAGGCVRDLLLGRHPKDFDVATSANPDEVRELFGRKRTLAIGAAFGVVMVLGPRGVGPVEVATFRRDGNYSDGRRPDSVEFSTPREDAQRRDFTINGLFYDPVQREVIDYVGGQADLDRRVVRAIGDPDARFDEDKLRMLRAVRFTANFDFTLDPATAAAIQRRPGDVRQVSAERITAELRRMLDHAHRRRAVELLDETQLLPAIFPMGRAFEFLAETSYRLNSSAMGTLGALRADATFATSLAIFLTCLADESSWVSSARVEMLGRAWRLTTHEVARSQWLMTSIESVRRASDLPWCQLQRVLIHDGAPELLDWLQSETESGWVNSAHLSRCQEGLALPADKLNPPPLINGNDLQQHGIPKGPVYRELLEGVRDAQLQGELTTYEAAMAWVDQFVAAQRPVDNS
jgi:tRNA nucleotidyltransferase/poly(A) polymerase